MMLNGGCFCGHIRYQVSGTPFNATHCHCRICRRTTGAPFVTWFSVPRAQFTMTCGTPTTFASTAAGTRTFCAHCGTQLTFAHKDFPNDIDVTTCSLDDPEAVPPVDQTYLGSRLTWIAHAGDLPAYVAARPAAR